MLSPESDSELFQQFKEFNADISELETASEKQEDIRKLVKKYLTTKPFNLKRDPLSDEFKNAQKQILKSFVHEHDKLLAEIPTGTKELKNPELYIKRVA